MGPETSQRGVIDTCTRYKKSFYAHLHGKKCAALAVRDEIALSDLYGCYT
jgi:hypothetical protein